MENEKKLETYNGKPTANKWKFLADRVVLKVGQKKKWTAKRLTKEFQDFVEYYSKERSVYVTKSRQKKGGSGAEIQAERVERVAPMTEIAFCVWVGQSRNWLSKLCGEYREKVEERDNPSSEDVEIYELLNAIRTYLNSQLLEGAVIGEYTPTIVASLLGMKNNVDVTSNGKSAAVPVINIVADNKTREQYAADEKASTGHPDPIAD